MSETAQPGLSENTVAATSYITGAPALIFLLLRPYNTSFYVRFHCWQSIGFNLVAMAAWMILRLAMIPATLATPYAISVLGRLVWLCWILTWILCSVSALNGRRLRLPVLGRLAEKQAGK